MFHAHGSDKVRLHRAPDICSRAAPLQHFPSFRAESKSGSKMFDFDGRQGLGKGVRNLLLVPSGGLCGHSGRLKETVDEEGEQG
jgi:hypothetical protein